MYQQAEVHIPGPAWEAAGQRRGRAFGLMSSYSTGGKRKCVFRPAGRRSRVMHALPELIPAWGTRHSAGHSWPSVCAHPMGMTVPALPYEAPMRPSTVTVIILLGCDPEVKVEDIPSGSQGSNTAGCTMGTGTHVPRHPDLAPFPPIASPSAFLLLSSFPGPLTALGQRLKERAVALLLTTGCRLMG